MTNDQLLTLKPGDVVRSTYNGIVSEPRELTHVGNVIQCSNPNSGAFGHYARLIAWKFGESSEMRTSIQSDEYTRGAGYQTHDANGNRASGWDLL